MAACLTRGLRNRSRLENPAFISLEKVGKYIAYIMLSYLRWGLSFTKEKFDTVCSQLFLLKVIVAGFEFEYSGVHPFP